VRLTDEAIDLARIAAAFAKENMSEYVCRIVVERARQDIDRYHAELHGKPAPKPKGKG
jgi:uncharacterized protein (DUF1778 family)